MKRAVKAVLIVVLSILLLCTLAACNTNNNGGGTGTDDTVDTGHGTPSLYFTYKGEQITEVGANMIMYPDEFHIGDVKVYVKYSDGYLDTATEKVLTTSMVQNVNCLTDVVALKSANYLIKVNYTLSDGSYLSGRFPLRLQEKVVLEYVTLTFDLNGGTPGAGFEGTPLTNGNIRTEVVKNRSYTWAEFISTFPITPPTEQDGSTKKALSSWGTYTAASTDIAFGEDATLKAGWVDTVVKVVFNLNSSYAQSVGFDLNDAEAYATAPVVPDTQTIDRKSGFVVQPSTSAFDTYYGFAFAGWYQDTNCQTKWSFSADVVTNGKKISGDNQSITLYAKWIVREKYTVKFHLMNSSLSQDFLQSLAVGQTASGISLGTIAVRDAKSASYVLYTSGDGTNTFISVSTSVLAGATTLTFTKLACPINSTLPVGNYKFVYAATDYYFALDAPLEASTTPLALGCLPDQISYSGLQYGDKYFTQDAGVMSGIPLAFGADYINSGRVVYRGKTADGASYYYTFAGWYTSASFESDTLFDFSAKVTPSAYDSDKKTLDLYAKWQLVDDETLQASYYSDFLFKDKLTLKADGTVRIDGMNDAYLADLTIPATIRYDFGRGAQTYEITEIAAKAFFSNKNVVSVTFGTVEVGENEVNYISKIGEEAFRYCESLENVNVSALSSLQSIGLDAFGSTKWLSNNSTSGGDYLIVNKMLLKYVGDTDTVLSLDLSSLDVTVIADGAFKNMQKLISVTIGKDVTRIDDNAFYGCSALLEVKVEDGSALSYVGSTAFASTKWIDGKGMGYVRAASFDADKAADKSYYVLSLTGFQIAETQPTADTFADGTFYLQNSVSNANMSLILGKVFYRFVGSKSSSADYNTANVPASIETISAGAFANYTNVKNIVFGDVSKINLVGKNAFSTTSWYKSKTSGVDYAISTDLTTYVSGDGFSVLNGILLGYWGSATYVTIPDTVREIAAGAFSASSATNLLIGKDSSLKKIDGEALLSSKIKAVSFLASDIFASLEISSNSFYTSADSMGDGFMFYLTNGSIELESYISDTLKASAASGSVWSKFDASFGDRTNATLSDDLFASLQTKTVKVNPSVGISSKYLITTAEGMTILSQWQAMQGSNGSALITGSGENAFIANGAIVTRSDNVASYEPLYVSGVTFVAADDAKSVKAYDSAFTAVDDIMDGEKAVPFRTYYVKFTIDGVSSPVAVSETEKPFALSLYAGVATKEGSTDYDITVSGLEDVYYTSQTALNATGDDKYITLKLLNGYVDTFRLDNKEFSTAEADSVHYTNANVVISGYTSTAGRQTMVFTLTYYGFNKVYAADGSSVSVSYTTMHPYTCKVPAITSIVQATPFEIALNSTETAKSSTFKSLIIRLYKEDGTTEDKNMTNCTLLTIRDEADGVFKVPQTADRFDTSTLGVHYAMISYGDTDSKECLVFYTVYVGTQPSVFTYTFNADFTATITGISTEYKSTHDATLMLPTSVVYTKDFNSASFDNKTYTITSIAAGAFKDAARLQTVYVSNTIKTIGNEAFSGCTSLKNVYSFDNQSDVTTPLVDANPSLSYYVDNNVKTNMIEPITESVTYYSTAEITTLDFKQPLIVIPYTVLGKSGTETVDYTARGLMPTYTGGVVDGGNYSYTANYQYVLSLRFADGFAIPGGTSAFTGDLYVPDTDYFKSYFGTLKAEAEEKNEVLPYTVTYYPANTAQVSTLGSITITDGTSTASAAKASTLNFVATSALRTGSCALLPNASLPLTTDGELYVPANYSGTYSSTVVEGDKALQDAIPVTYDYKLTSLMDGCFAKQSGLKTIFVPNTITGIWGNPTTFNLYASGLSSEFNRYVYTAGESSYVINYNTADNSIASVTVNKTADAARKLVEYFSDSVETIGENAFNGCTSLVSIDFSKATSLTEIDKCAFNGCTALTSIDLTATKITEVYENTFYGCTALTFVKLPKVEVIGGCAFYGCNNLTASGLTFSGGDATSLSIVTYAFGAATSFNGDEFIAYAKTVYGATAVTVAANAFSA